MSSKDISSPSALEDTTAALSKGWGAFSSALASVGKTVTQSVSDAGQTADRWSKEQFGEKKNGYKGTTGTVGGGSRAGSVPSAGRSNNQPSNTRRPDDVRAAAAEAAERRMQAVNAFY